MSAVALTDMTESIASNNLAQQLWISLASLMRSHVAMHSIARPGGALRILLSSDSAFEVLGPNGRISITGPGAAGMGSTEFRPETGGPGDEYATFFFTGDGLIQLEGSDAAMDVEAVVEYWLRKVQA